MTKQERFFYTHASYSVAPGETRNHGKLRSAKQYAEAERFAIAQDWKWEIYPDTDADDSWMDDEPKEYQDEWRGKAWAVTLWDSQSREILASLCGCYGNSDYERVVKAELALEAMKSDDFESFVPAGDIPLIGGCHA